MNTLPEPAVPIDSPKRSKNEVLHSSLAGGLCGLAVDLFFHPLDTIKTRVQVINHPDIAQDQTRVNLREAIRIFYAGNSMNLVALPTGCLYFLVYEGTKHYIEDFFRKNAHASLCHFIAGTLAETASIIVRNPFEVVKQQMQVGLSGKIRDTFKYIYQHRGLRGFYVGFWSFVLREAPFSAIQMPTYEFGKRWLRQKTKRELRFYENAMNGAFSGTVAALATNPLDMIKTKLMTGRAKEFETLWGVTRKIYREHGIGGYFKGCGFRVSHIGASSYVFFCLYEKIKSKLATEHESAK